MKREVFTIFEVDNGFMGQVGQSIVVGTTLSEACSAAQAQYAQNRVLQEEDEAAKEQPTIASIAKATWQKL